MGGTPPLGHLKHDTTGRIGSARCANLQVKQLQCMMDGVKVPIDAAEWLNIDGRLAQTSHRLTDNLATE